MPLSNIYDATVFQVPIHTHTRILYIYNIYSKNYMYLFIDLMMYLYIYIYIYVCMYVSVKSQQHCVQENLIIFFVRLLGPKTLVISCDMILKNAQTNHV